MTTTEVTSETPTDLDVGLPPSKYLCLTILGYRKPGQSEEAHRRHMITVSAPMTKDLMVKYGVKRWTVVVFESVEHYKMMKEDPYYKEHLFGDHEHFADTKNSQMTIGWIEEWINNGEIRDGLEFPQSG
ncbi:hypothetical protein MW887_010864 [Aspergillus wentii]|nr:hypothetical protein MW887_010864 [Aspergillus wentii]